MTDKKCVLETARKVLRIESEAVSALISRLDDNFERAVEIILSSAGKVVVTGMGKSGIIGQKIASTLASTGTSALFLHPAEGVHGDLGVLMKSDVLIALSNSGETEEILRLIPAVKRLGTPMIIMTGNTGSTLAGYSESVLDTGVAEEAYPLGLAPTSSTTAATAMGDALAVALLEQRGFNAEDFASLHPAGSLGKKLKKVTEYMQTGSDIPRVAPGTPMKETILEMTKKRLGVTGVFEDDKLVGIVTDGDLRRALEHGDEVFLKWAGDIMTHNPKVIEETALVESALNIMDEYSITSIFVVAADGATVLGIVHLHDLIKAGVL